jgi:hypothetical protein
MDIFNSSHSVPHTALHWDNASYAEIDHNDIKHLKKNWIQYKDWVEISKYLKSQHSRFYHPNENDLSHSTIFGTNDQEILKIFTNHLVKENIKVLFFNELSNANCVRFNPPRDYFWSKENKCYLSDRESALILNEIKRWDPEHRPDFLNGHLEEKIQHKQLPFHLASIMNQHNPNVFYTSDKNLYKFYIEEYLAPQQIPVVIEALQGKMYDEKIHSSMPLKSKGQH